MRLAKEFCAGRLSRTQDGVAWKCRTWKMTNLIQVLSRNPISNVKQQALPSCLYVFVHAPVCFSFFTVRLWMHTYDLAIEISLCQSNFCPYFYTIRKIDQIILVFPQEKWLVGRPLLPEILGQTDPVPAKTPIFDRYSLVVH